MTPPIVILFCTVESCLVGCIMHAWSNRRLQRELAQARETAELRAIQLESWQKRHALMVMKTNELIAELTEEKTRHAGCLRALASAQKGWGTAARRVQILEAAAKVAA